MQQRQQQHQQPVSFEASILHRSYTFLKTNSKGSQRSKNIFFYTNNGRITTPRTTGSRTINKERRTTNHKTNEPIPNYLIKSIKKDEFDTLINTILPKYVSYMEQYGRISLLNRIYGVYEIIIHEGTEDEYGSDSINAPPLLPQKHHTQRYYLVVLMPSLIHH